MPLSPDDNLEHGAANYCFYTLCPTLHPGLQIDNVRSSELACKEGWGVTGLVTEWLQDHGDGYQQAIRPGFLLGIATSDEDASTTEEDGSTSEDEEASSSEEEVE